MLLITFIACVVWVITSFVVLVDVIKKKVWLGCLGFLIGMVCSVDAFPIHLFPGIDKLIEEAKYIAVIKIVEHVSGDGQAYDEYHVLVERMLKGSIPEGETTAMSLCDLQYWPTNGMLDSMFVNHRSYLVFFDDAHPPYYRAPYRNLQTSGSCWEVALPNSDWRPDPNVPIRDTVKMLVNENLKMKERILKGEQARYWKIFGDENHYPTNVYEKFQGGKVEVQ